jgi:hypothetical protein
MTHSPIRIPLTEAAVAEIMEAVTAQSTRLIGQPDQPYSALERRWREIGGMIELARVLDAWRLVRPLEIHKDALRRQMVTLFGGFTP